MIYLIGFMGTGKTTFAKKIAAETELIFHDLDYEIEKRENRTISSIFANDGEDYFRKLETDMLLHLQTSGIIATGGGIVESLKNRSYLRNESELCIWLNTPWKLIESRIIYTTRPLVKYNTPDGLYKLWQKRLPLYSQSAHTICHSYPEISDVVSHFITKKRAGI